MKNELLAPNNIVQVMNEIGIIRKIDDKIAFVEFKNHKRDIHRDFIKGLQITEKWLDKLGFTQKETTEENFGDLYCLEISTHYDLYNCVIERLDEDAMVTDIRLYDEVIEDDYSIYHKNTFLYIHQLQNLIHIITGSKLVVDFSRIFI